METRLPIEHVRVGDELLHPIADAWRLVLAITAPDHLGRILVTLSDGTQIVFPAGDFVTVSHAPYICTKCEQAGWICPSCGRAKPARGACPCGTWEEWVWGMLPQPRPSTPDAATTRRAPAPARPALPITPEPTLEQRILAAVRERDLSSVNAVVKEIGGRRQDIYAAVKAMLGDNRLRVVDGYLRAGG